MQTYRAPRIPLTRRLAGSGGFNIFLVLTVIIATVYFIYTRRIQKSGGAEPVQVVSNQPPQEEVLGSSPPPPAETRARVEDKSEDILQQAAMSLFKKSLDETTTTTVLENPAGAAATRTRQTPQIIVHFLEVPQRAAGALFVGGEVNSVGLIPDFQAHLNEAKRLSPDLKTLTRLEKTLSSDTAAEFEQTWNDGKGLFIRVISSSGAPETMNLRVILENKYASGPNPGAGLQSQEMEGSFAVSSGAAIYFAGAIVRPPNVKPEEEEFLVRHPVYKALSSPLYLQDQSEIFVFFELKGLNADAR